MLRVDLDQNHYLDSNRTGERGSNFSIWQEIYHLRSASNCCFLAIETISPLPSGSITSTYHFLSINKVWVPALKLEEGWPPCPTYSQQNKGLPGGCWK